jgi:hypothetical protein
MPDEENPPKTPEGEPGWVKEEIGDREVVIRKNLQK